MVLHDTFHPALESYPKSPYDTSWIQEALELDVLTNTDDLNFLFTTTSPNCIPYDDGDLVMDELCNIDDQDMFDVQTPNGNEISNGPHHQFSFVLEWSHKKGKKKPQQYWVYCEDKQQSYARVSLVSQKITWTSASRMFIYQDSFHFVQNFTPKADFQTSMRLEFNSELSQIIGVDSRIPTSELIPVNRNNLHLNYTLENDIESPIHPQQGEADEVKMTYQPGNFDSSGIREPFQFTTMFSFKNRVEGWFKLKMALSYNNVDIISGYSDIFMFNNPRLKKRKELAKFSSPSIKYMQIFALTPNADEQQWMDNANSKGLEFDFLLALTVFGRQKRKIPPDFGSSPVPMKIVATDNGCCVPSSSPIDNSFQFKTYLYQWLTDDGQKEVVNSNIPFFAVHLPTDKCNFEDFIVEVRKKHASRAIRKIYLEVNSKLIEITNSIDFVYFTKDAHSPQLLISSSQENTIQEQLSSLSSLHSSPPSMITNSSPSEFVFTVQDPFHNIREVYISTKTLNELRRAIITEFNIPQNQQISLFKASNGALIHKDKNLQHIKENDTINAIW